MSYLISPDEQSEDGELQQSPSKHDNDFSLSDDDTDKMDSLNIKPPQSQSALKQGSRYKKWSEGHTDRHRKHSSRYKESHSHHAKHKERKERDVVYSKEKDGFCKEKNYEQQFFQSNMQYLNEKNYADHKDSSLSCFHVDYKYVQKKLNKGADRHSDSSDSKHRRHRSKFGQEVSMHGGKALQDLRKRLLSKRSIGESSKSDEEYCFKDTILSNKDNRKNYSSRNAEGNIDTLLEGEAGSLVKEIIDISTSSDIGVGFSKHRQSRSLEGQLAEEERAEQEVRRQKLLEAEREMARQREQRERRHIEKQKQRRYEQETLDYKRTKFEEHIIVSDNSDDDRKKTVENLGDFEYSSNENDMTKNYKKKATESVFRSRSRDSSFRSNSSKSPERSSRSPSSSRSSRSNSSDSDHKSRSGSSPDLPEELTEKKNDSQNDDVIQNLNNFNENIASTERVKVDDDLPPYYPAIQGCRSVEEFQCLNRIAEGTYGVVYRARDKRTDDIVALKRLKMEKEKEGFPITSLREINTLLKGQHANIVTVREIVVGSNMDKIFIVMDYVEHDLKSLMETMSHKKQTFTPGEVKCLLRQLLEAVAHLHDNWILHRDLKTSNLLLSHKGILKVGDFGLAREYGSPLKPYTPVVVTQWYRAPELLLCCKEYSTPIDIWSVGCIFGELLLMNALFPGKSEVDQLNRIFKDLGTPNEKIWPGFNKLPAVVKMKFTDYPLSNLRNKFNMLNGSGQNLLSGFLTYDPAQRISAEKALQHSYFIEAPLPIDPAMFPTWPAKSELGHRKALAASPKPPSGGREYKQLGGDDRDDFYGFRIGIPTVDNRRFAMGGGFNLKF